jgi:hypothetical protein
VSFQDAIDSISVLRADKRFHPALTHLADLSGITALDMKEQEIYDFRRTHDPFSNENRRAVVVPESGLTHDAVVLYRTISHNPNFELFSSLPAALSWLGLSASVLPGYVSQAAPKSHGIDVGRRTELVLPEWISTRRMPG